MKDVHICPILMRTVIWIDGKCTEECGEDCPILLENEKNVNCDINYLIPGE